MLDDTTHADPTRRKPMYPMTGEELFWDLVEPMYTDPAVHRSTMMGLPCVRLDGRFFASLDRRTHALLVKLPTTRVGQLIADGVGEPFAPAGRVFREWVAVRQPDRERWQRLLTEASEHAGPPRPGTSPVQPADTTTFGGFSAAGLAFLSGLQRKNTKRYFDTHRRAYQQELLEPSKTLVVALGTELRRRISERLHAEPRIGGSLFRIANDLRCAKDKPLGLQLVGLVAEIRVCSHDLRGCGRGRSGNTCRLRAGPRTACAPAMTAGESGSREVC
jgi:hypothetical protein